MRSVAFDLPGLPVDTHVGRLARRLKLTNETDPVKAEIDLNGLVPPEERGRFSLRLILHGRQVCFARKPDCGRCVLVDICPSADPAATAAAATAIGRAPLPASRPARSSERPAPRSARSAWSSSPAIGGVVGVAVAVADRDDPRASLELARGWTARRGSTRLGEVGRAMRDGRTGPRLR